MNTTTTILGKLTSGVHVDPTLARARLIQLVNDALGTLRNPVQNPLGALAALGAVAGLLLVIVLFAAIVYVVIDLIRHPYVAPKNAGAGGTGSKPRRHYGDLIWVAVLLLVVVAAFVGWSYGLKDATCKRCHYTHVAFEDRAAGTHHAVACSDCHVAPGPRGALAAAVTGVSNVKIQILGTTPAPHPQAPVQNDACLKCHAKVTSGTVVQNGIRMRHSDVLAVGYACTDCHNTVAHGANVARPLYPKMSQCVMCHDGVKASSRCSICHVKDIGVNTNPVAPGFIKVVLPNDSCRGCHSMVTCVNCHGIELPHTQEFISGFHARKALLEPQVCVKCHSPTGFCNRCHAFTQTPAGLPDSPHAHNNTGGFITWHKTANGPGMGSCSCHVKSGSREQLCYYCHGPQPPH